LDFLQRATIAAQQENWSLLNQCLQHLLEGKSWQKADSLQVLNWALEILIAGDFQERWDVAKIFPALGKRAIAPLIAILSDEDAEEELHWFGARILGDFNDPAVISAMVELLKNAESEDLSAIAVTALASLGKDAIAALTNLLNQEEWRLLAVLGLANIRTKEVISPFLAVVNDPQVQVRAAAIEALGSFHDPRIPSVLIAALKDVAAIVRKEAVIALGVRTDLRDKLDLVNVLKPLLWDFNIEVCQQAAIALGRLGSDAAVDALFQLWQSSVTPLPLQLEAIRSLGWVSTSKAINYLREIMKQNPDLINLKNSQLPIFQEIITVLGRVENQYLISVATEVLVEFWRSHPAIKYPEIRQAVAMSLGQLGDSQGIDLLLNLLEDEDLSVRLHAIAALKKFPTAIGQITENSTRKIRLKFQVIGSG